MKQKLLQIILLAGLSVAAKTTEIPGLVRNYPLDNSLVDQKAGLHLTGDVTYGYGRFCDKVGAAAFFQNTAGLSIPVEAGSVSTLLNSNYTYSVWLKLNAPATVQSNLLAIGNPSGGDQILFINYNNFGLSADYNNSTNSVLSTTRPTAGQWYHVVGVKRDDSLLLFVNGKRERKTLLPPNSTAQYGNNSVASLAAPVSSNYRGFLDDVKIFNRGITDAEVLQLYDADKNNLCHTAPSTDVPIRYYAFDNNGVDSSAFKANITVSGREFVKDRFCKPYKAMVCKTGLGISLASNDGTSATLQDYTYSVWLKTNVSPNTSSICIFSLGNSTGDQTMGFNNNGFFASSYYLTPNVGATSCISTTVPTVDKWYHVASVKLQDTLFLYVNGVLEQKKTLPKGQQTYYGNATPVALLGKRSAGGMLELNGVLDDFKMYNKGLHATQIMNLYTERGSPCTPPKDSLVRDFRFSNNFIDSSRFEVHITPVNKTFMQGHTCDPLGAVITGNGLALPFVSEFMSATYTYSTWIKPYMVSTNPNDNLAILSVGSTGGDQTLMLVENAFRAASYINSSTAVSTASTTKPVVNKWYHLVSVRAKDTLYIYVNGNLETATEITGLGTDYGESPSAAIGFRAAGGASPFSGEVSDVKIYNVAFSPGNVKQLYNATKPSPSCVLSDIDDSEINGANHVSVVADDQGIYITAESKILNVALSNSLGQKEYFGVQNQIFTLQKGILVVEVQTEQGMIRKRILLP